MARIALSRPAPPIIRINRFKGINQNTTPTQIDDAESPDMLNNMLDTEGALVTRPGYARVFETSLGAGKVNGIYEYKKIDGTIIRLLAHGTKLYTWDLAGAAPVEIYSGKADDDTRFFTFGNYCYIMDGTNFLRYDGTSVVTVESVAYIPTLTLGRTPDGGGTAFENWNLLSAGFRDSFSGDGVKTAYHLSLTNLDATAVTATVNGSAMTEGAGFTVNRTTGVVTFSVAPSTGVANNVVITAYKTQSGYADRVKKCRGFEIYGGTNDTRVFAFGNPDYPNTLRRCGLEDPTYWPELSFANVGSDASAIKGMHKQYSNAIILKEPTPNGTTIFSMSYSQDADGNAIFPIIPLNSGVGCTAQNSIQLIENDPVFFSPTGVWGIYGTNVSDERNVKQISDDINPSLLAESGLEDAVSADFEKKYILVVDSKAYVQDYRIKYPDHNGVFKSPWYIWDNIPASCFLEMDGYLYFGSNSEGLVYKFYKSTDAFPYNDDGEAITKYWKSKIFSFDDAEHLKTVEKVFFSLQPGLRSSADLYYATDRTESGDATAVQVTARVDLLDFSDLEFDHFSFMTSSLPQEIAAKIKAKKIVYFQVILSNDRLDESMGILSVGLKIQSQREVK